MQEQAFLDELEQLGLLEIEDSVKWKMHRLDITQDFYVKCDPSLMVKIIRYAGSVDPYRKGHALHYNRHNEIRSCKFEKTWYDFALYDKHQQLLNCEKESYPISPDDLEHSKNLVRYEIQLKRPSLKEFEHDKLESKSSKFQFGNHALFHYFDKISDDIPLFLYRYAVDYFGKHSWYNVPTALKAVKMSNLDADTKELVSAYIEAQDEPELTDKMAGSPNTLCVIQCKVQRVLANHTNRGHSDLDTRTTIVTVEEHKICGHFVSSDDVLLRQLRQHPDLLATLQRTGSFISNALTQQVIGELECFFVLHNAVTVRYDTEHGIIRAADIRPITGNHSTRAGIDITALYLPIQTSQFQSFTACRGIHHDTAKAMPRGLTDREHGFNICRHNFHLQNF